MAAPRRRISALSGLVFLLVVPRVVGAQEPRLPRTDASVTVGWLHSNLSGSSETYDRWASRRATLTGQAGFYWTEHWKTELVAERSNSQDRWRSWSVVLPTGEPVYGSATDAVWDMRVSIGQFYQFGHNAWTHLLLGGGVGITRRHTTRENHPLTRYDRSGPVLIDPGSTRTFSDARAAPFGTVAVKAYVAPRVFMRSDMQVDFRSHLEAVVVRIGFGVDF